MNIKWFTVFGLIFDIAGAIFLSYGLIISRKKAIELGISRISSNDDENLELPQVIDLLKQSRNAIIGLALLVFGFLLQIIGSWPQ